MSNHHLTAARRRPRLAVLLDALDGVAISDAERASLTWLAGFEGHTVENITVVIIRARQAGSGLIFWSRSETLPVVGVEVLRLGVASHGQGGR